MATIITGDAIANYQFLARMHALRLEILGMKKRGESVYSICKSEYGLSGNKQSVHDQMKALWEKQQNEV